MSDRYERRVSALGGLVVAIPTVLAVYGASFGALNWASKSLGVGDEAYAVADASCRQGYDCEPKDVRLHAAEVRLAQANFRLALFQSVLNIAGLSALALTVYYAHKAWVEAQRTADGAERLNRPHMHVHNIELIGLAASAEAGKVKNACEFKLFIQNYGNTPGFVTRWNIVSIPLPALPGAPDYDEAPNIEVPVPVGSGLMPSTEPVFISVDEPTRAKLRSGELTFFVWGFVEYDDLARRPHKTRFVYHLRYSEKRPDGGKLVPVRDAPAYWEHT